MKHQKQALQQIEMLNHVNAEITRKYMETMTTLDPKPEETFYVPTDDGKFDITPAGIRFQAECFWRDNEFYDICCDNEDEDNHLCKFEAIGKIDAQNYGTGINLVIHNECKNREGPAHSYYVTLLQEDDGGNHFYVTSINPIDYPDTPRLYEHELHNNLNTSLTTTEIQFWGEVAKIYPTIPSWMIEHDLTDWDKAPWGYDADEDEEDSAICSTFSTLPFHLKNDLALIGTSFFDIPHMDPAWGAGWFTPNQNQNPCMEIALGQHEQPAQEQPEQAEQETYNSPFDGETK
jgi:hypothetical protein